MFDPGSVVSLDELRRLELALVATRPGSRKRQRKVGSGPGDISALQIMLDELDRADRDAIRRKADELAGSSVSAIIRGASDYPRLLDLINTSPTALFFFGKKELLSQPSIGICGSRNVSDVGLQAARACGEVTAEQGLVSVSGYARGVDTETHVASLRHDGGTIIVLPEGIDHFRVKRGPVAENWDPERIVVVSQFAPGQPWTAGGAMTRNSVIIGLSMALLVVEAGESGGTLAAGKRALELNRRVLALEFAAIPGGNRILLQQGAIPVTSKSELRSYLHELVHIADEPTTTADTSETQGKLDFSVPGMASR
jgi:DNA processing protein